MFRKLLAFVSVVVLVSATNVIAGKGPGTRTVADSDSLSDVEMHYLEYMRLEEKLARDSYITLYDLWGKPVFLNISESEQQHTDAVEKLLDKYGLPDPVLDESIDYVGDFFGYEEFQTLFALLMAEGYESELDALYVGAKIEEKDMLDIQKAIDATNNEHIKSVFENLLCGSRNHLRAFVMNIELQGATYDPPVYDHEEISQEEIDELNEIAHSPTERCR